MTIALAASQDHIATVFDSADSFVIIDTGTPEKQKIEYLPPGLSAVQMIKVLRELKITVLLCGAISVYSQQMIEAADILVISFLKGELKDVAAAFFANRLDNSAFCLPGCHRGWQRMAMGKGWEGTPSLTERPRGQRRRGKS
jgi:predicted Fe-Mo cluster-binding NifX family protein